jgi:hypothetical protein
MRIGVGRDRRVQPRGTGISGDEEWQRRRPRVGEEMLRALAALGGVDE